MRIGIDCRFAAKNAGLGRYTRSLVTELVHRDDGFEYVLFVQTKSEAWLQSIPEHVARIEAPFAHYSFAEQIKLPRLIKQASLDHLFVPHFNVPLRCPVPFTITVHDLILHRYPNQASLPKRLAYRFLMKFAVTRAQHIIAVSKFTADELQSVYGSEIADKIQVIYEGVEPHFQLASDDEKQHVQAKYELPDRFLLYVGNAKEHKNVPWLLEQFSQHAPSDLHLVLVSGGKEADQLTLPDRVIRLADVDDVDLPALYTCAAAFITASRYEGFGLPIVEATACGCPVIAANTSAIPEVIPTEARLFDLAPESFGQALQQLPDLISETTQEFSWEKAADETIKVLMRTAAFPLPVGEG